MDSLVLVSALIGLACAGLTVAVLLTARRPGREPMADLSQSIALVFDGDRLIDADDAIWPLLPDDAEPPDWHTVRSTLAGIAPGLPMSLDAPPDAQADGPAVSMTCFGKRTRIDLSPAPTRKQDWFTARRREIAARQAQPALDHSPNPIWSLDGSGRFLWGNEAFDKLSRKHGGPAQCAAKIASHLGDLRGLNAERVCLPDGIARHDRWFEVTQRQTDTGILHFATAVDAVVQAEEAQRNFVQTLSKTFANLTTGLAIFDRDRRLALFNPALIDLSGLPVDFLSGRPNLFEFFDKLRERQFMPEPKNISDWRERMAKLVAAASDDRFRETWNLAGGQTFDVTGRPYPDGAIAFLFNDITAEVSLTRGFRTELETMQSTIDAMEDAVAVFNQQGVLTVCNSAFRQMWNVDPDSCIVEATIGDATQDWKAAFHPSPVWSELRDFVTNATERASWDTELRAKDGREVICRVDPICFGATLIRFCPPSNLRLPRPDSEPLQIVSG
ncbi:PAS-domain containing protein [Marivita sp. GX14005]|uniref:PAS-domain containing protein n=1 Tax=Marivita sp. GX14005 TaxID=2942276 RepID=UPI0020185D7B|nr:PAS-domain containing protein [Marivita sp. GX14005]MCL3881593.1 PAS-domain containing protein [Marivita sp. GX14005]